MKLLFIVLFLNLAFQVSSQTDYEKSRERFFMKIQSDSSDVNEVSKILKLSQAHKEFLQNHENITCHTLDQIYEAKGKNEDDILVMKLMASFIIEVLYLEYNGIDLEELVKEDIKDYDF